MKLYGGRDGRKAYDLAKEAVAGRMIDNDYNRTNSQFVRSIYETAKYRYTMIDDIDNGILHSIEKTAK